MVKNVLSKEIQELIDKGEYEELKKKLSRFSNEELIPIIESLPTPLQSHLLQVLPEERILEILTLVESDNAFLMMQHLDPMAIENILQKLDKERAGSILQHFSEIERQVILLNSAPSKAADYVENLPDDMVASFFQEIQDDEAKTIIKEMRTEDAVQLVRDVPSHLRDDILTILPPDKAADILEYLPSDMAAAAVMDMSAEIASTIVQEMRTDDEVDLLQEVSPEHAENILNHVHKEDADLARELLSYDENTAGGLMQKEYIAIPQELTAKEVVKILRIHAKEYAEYPVSYLYVIDGKGNLDGVVSLRNLLLCEGDTKISSIMSTDVRSIQVDTPGDEIVKIFRRTHYIAVPVTSLEGELVGIVTHDDALRFAEEDADEELLRFTGIVGGEELRDMPLLNRSWKRLSWLMMNVLLNLLAASIISSYEDTLQVVIALAIFMPIISDMSGCSGNQAVAVSIRELSLDRIKPKDFLRVLLREAPIGLINGFVLGFFVATIAWLWKGDLHLGIVIGVALWSNSVISVSLGSVVPLLLRHFNFDPAIASSLILTTFTDMCGFFLILGMASKFLMP